MKGIALIALVAACVGCKTDERIAKLERRVTDLEIENSRLTSNDEALRKVVGGQFADVFERLFRADLVDEKNVNILRWWCIGDGACFRNLVDCDKSKATGKECDASRIAYCVAAPVEGHYCVRSLSLCERLHSKPCYGIE